MALSCVVSEMFMSKNVVTMKSGSKVTQDHFMLVFFINFVPKTHRFWDIRLQKCRDLGNRVSGPSRSLEMSPLYRAHMTSYWSSIVIMALSLVVTLRLGSEVTQCHWKWYHSVD